MRSRIWIVLFTLLCAGASLPAGTGPLPVFGGEGMARAGAADAWRREFDDVCGRTASAPSLTVDELTQMIARCEKLRPLLEKLEDPERKVFLRRLQMCGELYRYVLDAKRGEK